MLKDFKSFVVKGNVLDLAVAFIMGAAFGKIVASLVSDILMPPIGLLLGKIDFSNLFVSLSARDYPSLAAAKAAGAPVIAYGMFLNTVIEFLIVALALFLVIRQVNRFKKADVPPKECPHCCSNIPVKATRCPNCTSQLT